MPIRCLILALCLGLLAEHEWPAAGQIPISPASAPATNQSPAPPVVFSVSTTLVQTDAVVTDGRGRQVTGLKPEDFEVLLDGKPQLISNFSYIQLDSPSVNLPALSRSTSELASTGGAPVSVIRPADVRRSVVLMVDDLNLSFEGMATVRRALKNFVENQMQPGDLVAVWETGRVNTVFQQFTPDKRALLTAINSLQYNSIARGALDMSPPRLQLSRGGADAMRAPFGPSRSEDAGWLPREERAFLRSNLTAGALTTIDELLDELRQLGGRKALVLFSDGLDLFPNPNRLLVSIDYRGLQNAFRHLIDKANRSGTVIYTVDAQGLVAAPGGADERLGQALALSQAGLIQLAENTGGLPVMNGNGLDGALERVEEDQKGYYLIGFRAPVGINSQRLSSVDYHSIRVRLKVAGLHVRSRSGFWAETDEASKPQYSSAQQQMRLALFSLFNQTALHVRLSAFYSRNRNGDPLVRNMLYIDPHEVKFVIDADGHSKASLDVMILAEGASTDEPLELSRRLAIDAAPDKLQKLERLGILLRMDVPATKPGPYQVRASVRDANSAAIGSAGEYVLVPNVKQQHLALTTLRLDESDARADEQFRDPASVLRQFRPGTKLSLIFLIETDQPDRLPENFDASIELFSGEQSILKGPVTVTPVPHQSLLFARAELTIENDLKTGQYYLVAFVTQHSGKRVLKATGWTDFQVVQ
jgi:VWFA-related protein